ncbi:T9SS type B sorting domain-containing protein [Chitinophaga rhizophila]|uniref:Gliding motility-associated C-terminal domain-containing protein n=1 Tax=Chitinophaga rhizophila TaxID=2866212 RepID=A0ABS7G8M8_9BACT|nr:gliding motility-associated C-terminal domain-containing protein [Chitinophaga rhizophila]MBW8682903.1 gliding motility-associated C-terminal domain-containing protein [Chitinophaga rhizophila]
MRSRVLPMLVSFTLLCCRITAQTASFTTPDTVCVNQTFKIQNNSTGGSTYFWNFCSGSLFSTPAVTNLTNIGGALRTPTFLAMAKDGANYYAFITNNIGELVRYSFGTSYLNTPIVDNLGSMGGLIPNHTEGVQVVQDFNGWHVIIVGGTSEIAPRIVRISFGNSLANAPPVSVNWGNLGNMDYPHDLYITQEGGNWYGFTVNLLSNSITRFNFGNSVSNTPTAVNLGNVGDLSHPTGIFATQENGNWYVFVTNETSNSISRLDFGNSLTNTPTGVNLGGGGGVISKPRDLSIIRDCGKIFGLVVSAGASDLIRIDFSGGITSNFTSTQINSGGGFSFPHSISTIFREGNDLYAFITNATGHRLSRFVFNSCNSSSIASSSLRNPPDISYGQPGIYNINLLMNESSATQTTYCKTVVVLNPPTVNLGPDRTLCEGTSAELDAGPGFSSYLWNTGARTRTISANAPGNYQVTVSNGGCTATDNVNVAVSQVLNMTVSITDITCNTPQGRVQVNITGGTPPYTYHIGGTSNGNNNVFDNLMAGMYTIRVEDNSGCSVSRIAEVKRDATKMLAATAAAVPPSCGGIADGTINVTVTEGVAPLQYALNGRNYQASPSFNNLAAGDYIVSVRNASCKIDIPVTITTPPVLTLAYTKADEHCSASDGQIAATVSGGIPPYRYAWNGIPGDQDTSNLVAGTYQLVVTDQRNCRAEEVIMLDNLTLPPVYITNNDTSINIGQSVQLHALNAVDYTWSPVSGLSCTDCANPIAIPQETTTYTVTTVTGKNCLKTDYVTINVTFNNSVYVPTAFTPNGDGVNDLFVVKSRGVATYNVRIFNRWGQQMFTSNSTLTHWDGRYANVLQPSGTYVYIVNYSFFGQEDKVLTLKGALTLIR